MRRELHLVLTELSDGLDAAARHAGMRLTQAEVTLPVDLLTVLGGGGALLLADLPGSRDDRWQSIAARLQVRWQQASVADLSLPEGSP